VEALGRGPLSLYDLVLVEQHVDVGDLIARIAGDCKFVHHMIGRDHQFCFAEQQFCAITLKQHPVLGRHDQDTL
jgi:hypothetical protein